MTKSAIIKINNGGMIFTYNGNIIDDSGEFIILNDRKEGEIKISKRVIISIKEVSQ